MRTVFFQPAAKRDLIDIYTYIAEHDDSAAIRLVDHIRESAASLAVFPYRYPLAERYGRGVHKMSVAGYALFYRVTDSAVSIARVLHGRRDWDSVEF